MSATTRVGLLLLAAISAADKFDEENYGVKVGTPEPGEYSAFTTCFLKKDLKLISYIHTFILTHFILQFADACEVCKIVSAELDASLAETAGKSGVVETGYSVEKEKKKTKCAF